MQQRNLTFGQLFNLSFGFFGVQIAYALQSANISRIFATLGADPHTLSFFWILPPLMGMIVQPLVGKYSDKTWNSLAHRGSGNAPVAQCREFHFHPELVLRTECSHVVWSFQPYVPRYVDQYRYAAV